GTARVTYRAWDQTTGSPEDRVPVTPANTAFSSAVETLNLPVSDSSAPANNAPTLTNNGNANLTDIGEDNVKSAGDTVAQILGTSFFDADPVAREGIAVTGLEDKGSGRWMYSTNGGKAWKPVGAVSEANALLLGAGDRLRFQPAANFSGDVGIGVTY